MFNFARLIFKKIKFHLFFISNNWKKWKREPSHFPPSHFPHHFLQERIQIIVEKELYFKGGMDAYYYFKTLGIIK